MINQNDLGAYYYVSKGTDMIIANDGSSFSAPFFEEIRSGISSIGPLKRSERELVFPSNYQEDLVQINKKTNFSPSSWVFAACTVDESGKIKDALLVDSNYHLEGFVFDLIKMAISVSFFRGFYIKEDQNSSSLSGDDFLNSIGIEAQNMPESKDVEIPLLLDFDDEDDEEEGTPNTITLPKPVFEAGKKRAIQNLGFGDEAAEEVSQEDDQEIIIHVDRPTFSASSNKKPRNLGSTHSETKETEDIPVHVEVEKPVFQAGSNKKPKAISLDGEKKKYIKPAPKAEPAPMIQEEKKLESSAKDMTLGEKENQQVEPSTKVMLNLKPVFEAQKKEGIQNFDREAKKVSRTWSQIDILKIKPNVFAGERSVVKEFSPKEIDLIQPMVLEKLEKASTLPVSDHLKFCPKILQDDDKHFRPLFRFDLSKWDFVGSVVDKNSDLISCLLANKEEPDFCLFVSLEDRPLIEAISLTGASLDDRAIPYLNYSQLRNAAGL